MNYSYKQILFVIFLILPSFSIAQSKFSYHTITPKDIHGKIEQSETLHRLDTSKYKEFPKNVKHLLTQSAGLFISFKTTSPTIAANWCVTNSKALNNLTPIANKGLDLYIKRKGKWVYAGSGRPNATCSQFILVNNMNNEEKECLLYLPLYDETKSIEIGVEEKASFGLSGNPFNKRILIYGSSILQGASASRPGLAYPAILSRATGYDFINMGLSGSAKMEKSVADVIAGMNAEAFILDCVPNSSPQQITERTSYLVNSIRQKHPDKPIIMVQSIIRETGNWNKEAALNVKQQNENIKIEFEKLKKQGVKKLYFIGADHLIGSDHEGTVDGVHPNDLGFGRMVDILKPKILKILKKEKI
jgi:hypothetical protein